MIAKKKEKLPHSPLLIRPASQASGAIFSSIKIEDCYIKELRGDKRGTGAPDRSVSLVWFPAYFDGSGSDVSWACSADYFLCGERALCLTWSAGSCSS